MIYSELEAIGAEGSNEYGDYIISSRGKTSGESNVFQFVNIPNWANHVYFKYGIIQSGVPTAPRVIEFQKDEQTHQVTGTSISFNGHSSYDVLGTGAAPLGFILYDVYYENLLLDDIISHLADINWPYPTGTVQYFWGKENTSSSVLSDYIGTNRYSSNGTVTTSLSESMPAFQTRDNTGTLTWNSTYVDTSKSNSYAINKTSTYIDIKGTFYAAVSSAATWTFATVDTDTLSSADVSDARYYGSIWNDGNAIFSGVYCTVSSNKLQLRGMGLVSKGKNSGGATTSYGTYFQIRIFLDHGASAQSSSSAYQFKSYKISETATS